ncbi:MAG TPA: hypothetical protein RMI62_24045 [Polyangiaceae bacterium LLY-WYZ-15_(1-7)]|nr:hypothetical protein [Polyangiaceae bacterium LLY-WYZ-15_(1-7)]HJL32179.1 hypothetical protein [Polyangiaceae bacterium LLY-WYZ-15_(1-7)]
MMRSLTALTAPALVAAVLFPASLGRAYRLAGEELPSSDPAVGWPSEQVRLSVDEAALPRGLSLETILSEAQAAAHEWRAPCSTLDVSVSSTRGLRAEPEDGLNSIAWVNEGWAREGFPPDAVGSTDTLFQERSPGVWEIAEADVWLNGQSFRWSAVDLGRETTRLVSAALVHELGHVVGLLHPCELEGGPECEPSLTVSPMYPTYQPDQPYRLTADEQAAICELYPGCRCDEGERCVDGACVGAACEEPSVCGPDGSEPDPAPGEFGAACSSGDQCSSGVCLLDDGGGYCSRRCSLGCPTSATCTDIDGVQVCRLPQSGGCSSAGRGGGAALIGVFLVLLVRTTRKGSER